MTTLFCGCCSFGFPLFALVDCVTAFCLFNCSCCLFPSLACSAQVLLISFQLGAPGLWEEVVINSCYSEESVLGTTGLAASQLGTFCLLLFVLVSVI